jgi:hypothetical protein
LCNSFSRAAFKLALEDALDGVFDLLLIVRRSAALGVPSYEKSKDNADVDVVTKEVTRELREGFVAIPRLHV